MFLLTFKKCGNNTLQIKYISDNESKQNNIQPNKIKMANTTNDISLYTCRTTYNKKASRWY